MTFFTVFAFLALALAMCSIGLVFRNEPRQRQIAVNGHCLTEASHKATPLSAINSGEPFRLPICSLLLAVLALASAIGGALLAFGAALWSVLLLLLALWLHIPQASMVSRSIGFVVLALMALAGALHLIPGFSNPLLVEARQLTPDAIPYTLYANFDKGWAGYCLLLAIWPSQNSSPSPGQNPADRQQRPKNLARLYWLGFWPVWPLTLLGALGLALSLQLLQFAPKWPDFALQFIFCNLLLTCVAEEAFFRGLLQRPLWHWLSQHWQNAHAAAWVAIGVVSLLFGLAHLAGGWAYALVATVASIGYGWAYQRSGRIEVAIVAHAALNLVHLTLFTYPMLASA